MESDRDLEPVVGSGPSREEQGSNARRGNTDNNLLGSSEVVAERPVDKGLPTAPCTLKEEALASPVSDSNNNLSKGSLLLKVELVPELSG